MFLHRPSDALTDCAANPAAAETGFELTGEQQAEDESQFDQTGESHDAGAEIQHELVDEALVTGLRAELAAVDRAEERIAEGAYGRSVESGLPIPDERLEAEPLAERTVEEQSEYERSKR